MIFKKIFFFWKFYTWTCGRQDADISIIFFLITPYTIVHKLVHFWSPSSCITPCKTKSLKNTPPRIGLMGGNIVFKDLVNSYFPQLEC